MPNRLTAAMLVAALAPPLAAFAPSEQSVDGNADPAWTGDLINSAPSGLGPWRALTTFRARDDADMGVTTMAPDGSGIPFFFRGTSVVGVDNTIGGPQATGAKYSVIVRTLFDKPTSGANINRNYVGHASQMIVRSPDSGPAGAVKTRTGTYSGGFFAYHPYCIAERGATNLMDLACMEADVGIQPGASARIRRAFVANAFQSGQGVELDAAYTVVSSDPKVHWRDGYVLTDFNGAPAIDAAGALFAVRNYEGPLTAAWGFDLAQTNLTQGILRTPSVALGNGYLNIDAPNTGVEIGSTKQPGSAYFDFHSSGKPVDYDARIVASGEGALAIQAKTITLAGQVRLVSQPPASSASPCEPGQVAAGPGHVYVCTAPNQWRRAALSDW